MTESYHKHPAVARYLDEVCSYVKAKEVHRDIRVEISSHLEDIIEERMLDGQLSPDEAVAAAIKQMGEAKVVGEGLHEAHKPRTEWGLIAIMAVLIALAMVSIFALQAAYSERISVVPKLISGILGITLMLAIYFMDYRKLLRLSWPLYWGTLLLLAAAQLQGTQINGANHWVVIGHWNLNVFSVSPYLFLIAFAGMLQLEKERDAPTVWMMKLLLLLRNMAVYAILPVYFYLIAPAMAQLVFFSAGLIILLLYAGRFKLLLAAGVSTAAGAAALVTVLNVHKYEYLWVRLAAMFSDDPDATYAARVALEAVRAGGLWGQGFGIRGSDIPLAHSEMLFAYLVYSQGWIFGMVLGASALLLAGKMIRIGFGLKDAYGSKLVVGITAVLAVRMTWNILMCLGLLPILGFEMPIVFWSSTSIVEFAAVGLVLNAYRRKDMASNVAKAQSTA